MREIKFRGKRINSNHWFLGHYSHSEEFKGYFIEWSEKTKGKMKEVTGCTVGQFTGLNDKNGKEIYEEDVIEFKVDPSFYINAKLGDRYIIEYFGAGFFMKPIKWGSKKIDAQNYIGLLPPYQTSNMTNHYEVIGNIHDNPELLK